MPLVWLRSGKHAAVARGADERSALVVLDLQRDFLEPGGKNCVAVGRLAACGARLRTSTEFVDECRRAKGVAP